MSEVANSETVEVSAKPVKEYEVQKFPPFPEPSDKDFEDDIPEEERNFYKNKFKDLNIIISQRLHCSACDRHLGCSARNENRMRSHPMLRTLVCHTCHTFYNSGEFDKGEDGSELYCRWCGQGGQVYCCSSCPHVFCAKCIRRNLGNPKIKEIEELDDWKCFKCNNKCLWDLRAICWAVLRYCDLKNKITYATQDAYLKEAYQKNCAQDFSECCKHKVKKKEKEIKRKDSDSTPSTRKSTSSTYPAAVISKIPPTIQVKKFASISMEEPKTEKKAQKRPVSPKQKPVFIRNPIAIANKMPVPPLAKKVRMPSPVINPVRFSHDRKVTQTFNTYPRIRPKQPQMPMMFNGYNNPSPYSCDNINLSIESLTQGLDMSAVAAIASSSNDDVVCTPDFPLEPLCEVTEDNGDDDVQCITPGPVVAPKASPAMVVRNSNNLPDLTPENIVQMTDNDVTVNSNTGGLKFRVDPQTLSSNKMYRLPDGRIFAINANPNMPGGYSATIVAVTENNSLKSGKGTTFAAKLNPISGSSTPNIIKKSRNRTTRNSNKNSAPKIMKPNKKTDSPRICDMNVPVEWYRYNLIDAIDTLEFSLSRLHQLKKNATTLHLRTRSINEMRQMHRSLDRALGTSMTRFKEIRENLNKDFKQYLDKKTSSNISDDDDVEILPEEDDDPIFIDENSMESNANESQEVDLTAVGSSDFNDSGERSPEKCNFLKIDDTLLTDNDVSKIEDNFDNDNESDKNMSIVVENKQDVVKKPKHTESEDICNISNIKSNEKEEISSTKQEVKQNGDNHEKDDKNKESKNLKSDVTCNMVKTDAENDTAKSDNIDEESILNDNIENEKKSQESDMSEEMIEKLLKDDNAGNVDAQNTQALDISDEIQDIICKETI